MKTKLMISALLCAFFINAATADNHEQAINANLKVGYASDFYFRGAELSQEAVQATVGVNTSIESIDLFASYFTNLALESAEADTDQLTAGFGTDLFGDKIKVYAGLLHSDTQGSEAVTDAYIQAGGNLLVDLTGTVARNVDDSLYTYELLASYDIDLDVATLTLGGLLGNTDVTNSVDRDYSGVCAKVSKSFGDVDAYVKVARVDADDTGDDTVWFTGLTYKF